MPKQSMDLDALLARLAELNDAIAENDEWMQAPPTRDEQREMDEIDRKYFA